MSIFKQSSWISENADGAEEERAELSKVSFWQDSTWRFACQGTDSIEYPLVSDLNWKGSSLLHPQFLDLADDELAFVPIVN